MVSLHIATKFTLILKVAHTLKKLLPKDNSQKYISISRSEYRILIIYETKHFPNEYKFCVKLV